MMTLKSLRTSCPLKVFVFVLSELFSLVLAGNNIFKLLKALIFRKMRYVAAYLLAALGGNESPTAESIEKILSSVGIEAESEKLNKVISELKGKDLQTLIAEGNSHTIGTCELLVMMILQHTIFRLRILMSKST